VRGFPGGRDHFQQTPEIEGHLRERDGKKDVRHPEGRPREKRGRERSAAAKRVKPSGRLVLRSLTLRLGAFNIQVHHDRLLAAANHDGFHR